MGVKLTPNTCFGLVSGSHTYFLAADTPEEVRWRGVRCCVWLCPRHSVQQPCEDQCAVGPCVAVSLVPAGGRSRACGFFGRSGRSVPALRRFLREYLQTHPLSPDLFLPSSPLPAMAQARRWVKALRQVWLHCFRHTLRGADSVEPALADTSRLMAANHTLTAAVRELEGKAAGADSEYWKVGWLVVAVPFFLDACGLVRAVAAAAREAGRRWLGVPEGGLRACFHPLLGCVRAWWGPCCSC
eukprot:365958-Chlamydomonas_euryale.AAC.4